MFGKLEQCAEFFVGVAELAVGIGEEKVGVLGIVGVGRGGLHYDPLFQEWDRFFVVLSFEELIVLMF